MSKDIISITSVKDSTGHLVICNKCKVVISQDKGHPVDRSTVATRVACHISIPKTFFGEVCHEIMTLDIKDGSIIEGIVVGKTYSD